MKKSEDISIGRRIRDIRLGKNKFNTKYDQASFAKLIGSTVSALSNWENGRNKPNTNMLKKIADIGEISVDKLVYGQDIDYASFSELSMSIIEGSVLTDKEKAFLKEHFNEIIPVIYKTVYSAGNSNYLSVYLSDRLINIAEFENGDPLFSVFDSMKFDNPYPLIEQDFRTYLNEFSFFKGYTLREKKVKKDIHKINYNYIADSFSKDSLSDQEINTWRDILNKHIEHVEMMIGIKETLKNNESSLDTDNELSNYIKELVDMERDYDKELELNKQLLSILNNFK